MSFLLSLGVAVALLPVAAGAAVDAGEELAPVLRIEMRSQVQVHGPRVRLGDVAILSSPSLPVLQRALSLPIGQAPRVGETAIIERERIERWLRMRGLWGAGVQLHGALDTVVSAEGRAIPAEEIVVVARTALMAHLKSAAYPFSEQQIELQVVSQPSDFLLPKGGTLTARPLGNAPITKRMLVWVDASFDGHFVRAVPIHFEVDVYAGTDMASEKFNTGKGKRVDSTKQSFVDPALPSGLASGDMTATVNRSEEHLLGARLEESAITINSRKKPAVARGEWVNLVSHQGLVTLESRVEVLQDGQIGQTVRVRQANATGVVLARVSGPGQLEMKP
ncbi:flagella basal body P-ring formation protein FlgA [Xylophilus sp. ASV27]|uniref:flagella basal body P-ring formation protein FlgA n=1 Tax=Xylophilus sp. ASV27 TaxID=2795129 RepID=UPI0018ECEDAC